MRIILSKKNYTIAEVRDIYQTKKYDTCLSSISLNIEAAETKRGLSRVKLKDYASLLVFSVNSRRVSCVLQTVCDITLFTIACVCHNARLSLSLSQ